MARKTKQQIKNESRSKEVADTVASEAAKLIIANFDHIMAAAAENGWNGAGIGLKFTVNSEALVKKMTINIPRKAHKSEVYPESPADKIQEKMEFNDEDEDA